MTNKRQRLNILDLIVASLYLYYRKREDHFLSAFWAKFFLAVIATLFIFIPIRVITQYVPINWRCSFDDYLLIVLFLLWGVMYIVLSISTIQFSELASIELQAEEYKRGNRLATVCTVICFVMFVSVMFLMGPSGAGC